jgi:hypothetical protein
VSQQAVIRHNAELVYISAKRREQQFSHVYRQAEGREIPTDDPPPPTFTLSHFRHIKPEVEMGRTGWFTSDS